MKSYVISVALTAIAATLAIHISPHGKGSAFLPYIRLVSSLVLISVVILPLSKLRSCEVENAVGDFLDSLPLPEYEFYESEMLISLSAMSATQLESALKAVICEKYGIESDDISVFAEYTVNSERTEYSRVLVLLSGKAIFKNAGDIEDFVKELCGVKCDCAIE